MTGSNEFWTASRRRQNTAGAGSESESQKQFFQWFKLVQPKIANNILCFSIPNGGARNAVTGARLKAEGCLAGVPDAFLAAARCGKHGLFIEFKKKNGGTLSKSQRDVFPLLEAAGYGVVVCRGFDEARQAVEDYLAGRLFNG